MPQALNDFLSLDLMDWLKRNCLCSNNIHTNDLPWSSQFPFAMWLVWKQRNKAVFDNSPLNSKLNNLCIQTAREYFYCVSKGQKIKQQITIQVRWNRPPMGWFKLNADGASFGNLGKVGGGGLIRDHYGSWVKGYIKHIEFASNITAEFWALKDGLMLVSQLGITQLLVELDAKVVMDLMLSSKSSNNSFLLCSMIASTSFAGSTKSGSAMFIGKRINVQITSQKEVAP